MRAAAALLVGAVLLVGCTQNDPEQDAREAIERATGSAPTTRAPGGSTTTTAAPASDFEVDTTSGELPEGWPENFPLPEGDDVEIVDSAKAGDVLTVTLHVPSMEPAELTAFYRQQLDAAGFAILDESAGLTFDAGAYNGNVLIAPGQGITTATLTVVPV